MICGYCGWFRWIHLADMKSGLELVSCVGCGSTKRVRKQKRRGCIIKPDVCNFVVDVHGTIINAK